MCNITDVSGTVGLRVGVHAHVLSIQVNSRVRLRSSGTHTKNSESEDCQQYIQFRLVRQLENARESTQLQPPLTEHILVGCVHGALTAKSNIF